MIKYYVGGALLLGVALFWASVAVLTFFLPFMWIAGVFVLLACMLFARAEAIRVRNLPQPQPEVVPEGDMLVNRRTGEVVAERVGKNVRFQ